jgi:phage tail sheath gpL-like
MAVQFNVVPGNWRVPLFTAEINPMQTPYQSTGRLLLIGQKLTAGTAVANAPIQLTERPVGLFGDNSMLLRMYDVARLNAPVQEIWGLPVDDLGGGTAATMTITAVGAPVAVDTTLTIYIAGVRVRCAAYTTDTNAALATRLKAAIDATAGLPVTAGVPAGAVITLTARHKGTLGNSIRLDYGLDATEAALGRDQFTFAQPVNGAGDPDLATALANLSDEAYDWIACPYNDTTNLNTLATFLNGVAGRWSPFQQLYGHAFTVKNDTVANLSTFGNGRNDPHITALGIYKSPSPAYEWVAALAAVAASHLQDAPELSRPLHTLPLTGIQAPRDVADRPDITDRQTLYYDGIASYHVGRDGTVRLDRVITLYQLNDWGSPDASWLDVNTLAQNMYAIRYLKAKITGIWGRAALRDENPGGVQGVATPDDIRDTILHGYRELSLLNVVENEDLFAAQLIVERNQVDATRVDVFLPADQVNQLNVIAVNYSSYLQYGIPNA